MSDDCGCDRCSDREFERDNFADDVSIVENNEV